jgi:four helix bundle protein
MKESILRDKSKVFAIRIIKLYKFLLEEKKEFVISKQILRCGTSIGANFAEAIYGVSEADFMNKLSIAQKEASETIYWLELLYETDFITKEQFDSMLADADELVRLLAASIITMKKKKLITHSS